METIGINVSYTPYNPDGSVLIQDELPMNITFECKEDELLFLLRFGKGYECVDAVVASYLSMYT